MDQKSKINEDKIDRAVVALESIARYLEVIVIAILEAAKENNDAARKG